MKLNQSWSVLKTYTRGKLLRVAMPVGGIGTGTVSLGGRGDLRDWEIMNRPAKGFTPLFGRSTGPFFALFARRKGREPVVRALEGQIETPHYEGDHGAVAPNHGLPRFRECSFAVAYPLAQVLLRDRDVPVNVRLEVFNPFIPADADRSGIPVAVLRFVLENKTNETVTASVCGNIPNFIGQDGSSTETDWTGKKKPAGAKSNRNVYRVGEKVRGIFMISEGVDRQAEQWGTIALVTTARAGISYRTNWRQLTWSDSLLEFWDDFSEDGSLQEVDELSDMPMGSLAVRFRIPPHQTRTVLFLLSWHFPNRITWTPKGDSFEENCVGNYYATRYSDAWDVAEKTARQLPSLERDTVKFVRAFCDSDLPEEVKESALFNLSTLRTQTCFRTRDGRFFGFEGCSDRLGCCLGSCTHVWNYEQATALLFGEFARSMREVEFLYATDDEGRMSFRVSLPLSRATETGRAAADGQMGCLMKLYRDWQLSGDDEFLRGLWHKARKALEFCWLPGGWDADQDGVMEGCQHNTMDVEYYGPNPQMGIWYLGALRSAEEMARYLGEVEFAERCRTLFENGSQWIDKNLFNGEYYEHKIVPAEDPDGILEGLLVGKKPARDEEPIHQLGPACLVDQLVGQYMAHICGLGYLVNPDNVRTTLKSIKKYNFKKDLSSHFNNMRSFALNGESALLMATYPKGRRPRYPFPYFNEVMTGFEYTAAAHMLYEGLIRDGLTCIKAVRDRYDGAKRSPFDEAECGHHYARAMASWASVLALTGFRYSGVTARMEFRATPEPATFFWSNGYAWGICKQKPSSKALKVELTVHQGSLNLKSFSLSGAGSINFPKPRLIKSGRTLRLNLPRKARAN